MSSELWSLPSLKISCFACFPPGRAAKIGACSDRSRVKRILLSLGARLIWIHVLRKK